MAGVSGVQQLHIRRGLDPSAWASNRTDHGAARRAHTHERASGQGQVATAVMVAVGVVRVVGVTRAAGRTDRDGAGRLELVKLHDCGGCQRGVKS